MNDSIPSGLIAQADARAPLSRPALVGLAVLVLALWAWRMVTLISLDLPIYFDEAYYWWWSQHLDFGYYSKPPAVAWLIRLSTELFGASTPLSVRAPAGVLYSLTGVALAYSASRFFTPRVGALTLLLYLTLPVVSFYSWFITTDAPLMLAWAIALGAFWQARSQDRLRDWLLFGVACGAGLMSKYALVYLYLGLALFVLVSPGERGLLTRRGFWLSLLVALALFAPNLWWNATHDMASIKHTAELTHADKASLHWDELWEFFSGQALVFGPLSFLALLGVLARPASWRRMETRFLALMTLPPIVLMCAQALSSRAHLNWAATGYLAGAMLLAAALGEGRLRRGWVAAMLASNLALAVGFYHYHAIADLLGVPLSEKRDPYNRVWGWPELSMQVNALLAAHPELKLASSDRKTLSWLMFYGEPRDLSAAMWNLDGVVDNHYEMTNDIRAYRSSSFLYVDPFPPPVALTDGCAAVTEWPTLSVPVYDGTASLEQRVYRLDNCDWGGLP